MPSPAAIARKSTESSQMAKSIKNTASEANSGPNAAPSSPEFLPVFAGFEQLGLTGRDVARLVDVTPPTVSKWRRALVQIPGAKLAFLTLVLAHLLEDQKALDSLEAMLSTAPSTWDDGGESRGADAAAKSLMVQESLNLFLVTPAEIRAGSQRFRDWWACGGADQLQANWAKSCGQNTG